MLRWNVSSATSFPDRIGSRCHIGRPTSASGLGLRIGPAFRISHATDIPYRRLVALVRIMRPSRGARGVSTLVRRNVEPHLSLHIRSAARRFDLVFGDPAPKSTLPCRHVEPGRRAVRRRDRPGLGRQRTCGNGIMTSWAAGYVADIGYTSGFYRETAPSHMAFAALTTGHAPGRALAPKRVLELGFGQGFGLALLAAANPDVAFEGYDFNPEHVAHARRLIAGAGLRKPERLGDRLRGSGRARRRQRSRCHHGAWDPQLGSAPDPGRDRGDRSSTPAAGRNFLRLVQLHAGLGPAGAAAPAHARREAPQSGRLGAPARARASSSSHACGKAMRFISPPIPRPRITSTPCSR